MRKCTFCNILPFLFYQCLRITFWDFNDSAPFHRVPSLLPKTKFQLGALRASTKRIAATAPPTAQVCSGAEKPPRWRSPLPVTQFYCSSNMAVGAGSDSEVSWPHTHLLLITMPTQCLCAAQVRMWCWTFIWGPWMYLIILIIKRFSLLSNGPDSCSDWYLQTNVKK